MFVAPRHSWLLLPAVLGQGAYFLLELTAAGRRVPSRLRLALFACGALAAMAYGALQRDAVLLVGQICIVAAALRVRNGRES